MADKDLKLEVSIPLGSDDAVIKRAQEVANEVAAIQQKSAKTAMETAAELAQAEATATKERLRIEREAAAERKKTFDAEAEQDRKRWEERNKQERLGAQMAQDVQRQREDFARKAAVAQVHADSIARESVIRNIQNVKEMQAWNERAATSGGGFFSRFSGKLLFLGTLIGGVFKGLKDQFVQFVDVARHAGMGLESALYKLKMAQDMFNEGAKVSADRVSAWASNMQVLYHIDDTAAIGLVSKLLPAVKDTTAAMYMAGLAAAASKAQWLDAEAAVNKLVGAMQGRTSRGTDALSVALRRSKESGETFGQALRKIEEELEKVTGKTHTTQQALAGYKAQQESIAKEAGKLWTDTLTMFEPVKTAIWTAFATLLVYVNGLRVALSGFFSYLIAGAAMTAEVWTKGPAEAMKRFKERIHEANESMAQGFEATIEARVKIGEAYEGQISQLGELTEAEKKLAVIEAQKAAEELKGKKVAEKAAIDAAKAEIRKAKAALALTQQEWTNEKANAEERVALAEETRDRVLAVKKAELALIAAEEAKALREAGFAHEGSPGSEVQMTEEVEQRIADVRSRFADQRLALDDNTRKELREITKRNQDILYKEQKKLNEKLLESVKERYAAEEDVMAAHTAALQQEYDHEQSSYDIKQRRYEELTAMDEAQLRRKVENILMLAEAEKAEIKTVVGMEKEAADAKANIDKAARDKIEAAAAAFDARQLSRERSHRAAMNAIRMADVAAEDAVARGMIQNLQEELNNNVIPLSAQTVGFIQENIYALEREIMVRQQLAEEAAMMAEEVNATDDERGAINERNNKKRAANALALLNFDKQVAKWQDMNAEQKRKQAVTTTQQMLGLAQAAFGENKSIAVAQALVNTYEAANAAYKAMAGISVVGPALGAAAAAMAVVAGMKNVQAIRKAKPGGDSGGTGSSTSSMPNSSMNAGQYGGFSMGSSGPGPGMRVGGGAPNQPYWGDKHAPTVNNYNDNIGGDTLVVNQHMVTGAGSAEASREAARILAPGSRSYKRTTAGRYRTKVEA